jgi:hypothetical protein
MNWVLCNQLSNRILSMMAWIILVSIIWRPLILEYAVFVNSVGCRALSRLSSVRPWRSLVLASRSPIFIASRSLSTHMSACFDRIRSARCRMNNVALPVSKREQSIDEYFCQNVDRMNSASAVEKETRLHESNGCCLLSVSFSSSMFSLLTTKSRWPPVWLPSKTLSKRIV